MVVADQPNNFIIKHFHEDALRKAIVIINADLCAGRDASAGWCLGPQLKGWRVADELVKHGYFETSIDTKKAEIQSARYRITQKGIEHMIKLGDIINFKANGTPAKLLAISEKGYRFHVSYAENGEPVERWHDMKEFGILDHPVFKPAPTRAISQIAKTENYIQTLTSPELKSSDDETPAAVEADTEETVDLQIQIGEKDRRIRQLEKELETERNRVIAPDEFATLKRKYDDLQLKLENYQERAGQVEPLQRQVEALKTALESKPASAAIIEQPSETAIETMFFKESLYGEFRDKAAKQLQKLTREGWRIVYEQFVSADDDIYHVARLERETPVTLAPQPEHTHKTLSEQIDDALEEAIKTPRTVEADLIIDPDAQTVPVSTLAKHQPRVPNFDEVTESYIAGHITLDQFSLVSDALSHHHAGAES
jgi:hypothetical protein